MAALREIRFLICLASAALAGCEGLAFARPEDPTQREIKATSRAPTNGGAGQRVVCAEPSVRPTPLTSSVTVTLSSVGADMHHIRYRLYDACRAYAEGALASQEYAAILSGHQDVVFAVVAVAAADVGDGAGRPRIVSTTQQAVSGKAALRWFCGAGGVSGGPDRGTVPGPLLSALCGPTAADAGVSVLPTR